MNHKHYLNFFLCYYQLHHIIPTARGTSPSSHIEPLTKQYLSNPPLFFYGSCNARCPVFLCNALKPSRLLEPPMQTFLGWEYRALSKFRSSVSSATWYFPPAIWSVSVHENRFLHSQFPQNSSNGWKIDDLWCWPILGAPCTQVVFTRNNSMWAFILKW
jgi:hypothetical protein